MALARVINDYGTYHVYNKGQNGMFIFLTDIDKLVFLKILRDIQIEFGFQIFAYSIMINHYHLVFKDVGRNISKIIGLIQEKYAIFYNDKYNREGAVFMKPFQSKPIYNKRHFFIVLCYILNNPVKAGITEAYSDYPWNSPLAGNEKYNITDYIYVMHYFKPIMGLTLQIYIMKHRESKKICDMEVHSLTDYEAKQLFVKIVAEISGISEFLSDMILPEIQREIIGEALYQGISARQIAEMTNKTRATVQRFKTKRDYI